MLHLRLAHGVSALAVALGVASAASAQQNLPTFDIGAGHATRPSSAQRGGPASPAAANGAPAPSTSAPARPKADPKAYAVMDSSTALKTDTPILQTPYSIQVVPKQVLQDQQATRVEDAVKNVSGVQLPWTGGQYEDFVIRGFGTNNVRYRNGVRLPANKFEFANVDRVEVLKGPAAMLYGRNDPGGMINVITKQPDEIPSYYFQQQFGNYDYYRTTFGATGPVTQDKSVLYRFDGAYSNAGSFRDFVSSERVFIAPSVTWKPTPDDDLNVNFEYQHDITVGDNGIPGYYGHIANVPISRNYSNPGFGKDPIDSRLIDASWTHRFNESWKLRSGATVNWIDYTFHDNPVAYFQPFLEDTPDPQVRRGVYFENFHRRTISVFSDLTGKFETGPLRHEVLLGGNWFVQRQNNYGYFGLRAAFEDPNDGVNWFTNVGLYNPVYPALPFSYFNARRQSAPNDYGLNKDEWASIYFHDQISIGDMVHVMGGGRYDWAYGVQGSNVYDAATPYARPVIPADTTLRRTDRFSPKAGIVFTPLPFVSVYGSYAEGFGSNNFGRPLGGGSLLPETSQQWEWGVKSEMFDSRVLATLAFYQLTKQNVATLVGDGSFTDTKGEARSRGVELDVSGRITDAISLIATFALNDTRWTKVAFGDTDLGHRLPGAPTTSGSLWVKYDFQQPELRGLSVAGGVFGVGDMAGDNGYSTYYYSLPGYARVDLMAAYRFDYWGKKLTAQLNINNVNNARYFAPCLPYNCSKAFNGVGEPLTVKGALRVEF